MQSWWLLVAVLACSTVVRVNSYRIVCYFQSWAVYRTGTGNFQISNIDPTLCTHHVYAFAGINSNGGVTIGDQYSDIDQGGYKKFNAMRDQHPNIKTMIAIGGGDAGSQTFSSVIRNSNKRNTFVNNIVKFIQDHGFQGVDIDWEFPGSADKSAFVELLKALRSKFDQHGYVLSMAASADVSTIDPGYDVPKISQYVDFINVMTYDMHGSWEGKTGENSPMYSGPSDGSDYERTQNVDYMIKYFIKKGADKSKLNLGVGTYGNTYTLKSSSNNGLGAPTSGPGKGGPFTQGAGELAYFEICQGRNSGQWHWTWNDKQKSMYAVNGNQWVGFDNDGAVKVKSQYIKDNGLGGAMIWSIDMDDNRNTCGDGNWPLVKTIKNYLN